MRTVDAKIKVERSTHVSFLLDLNSNPKVFIIHDSKMGLSILV